MFVDYIIYMTYDLHGQWDHGNPWTSPGCPTGKCLRSHINLTETFNALTLITKAGAPSNKVVVGVTSYGRSFRMSEAGCTSPMCTFTGSAAVSNAAPGMCTDMAGYIANAEILDIIARGNVLTEMGNLDQIIVYDDYEWVAFMSDDQKAAREIIYTLYNFAGSSDWPVDLQSFDGDNFYGEEPAEVLADCEATYADLDKIVADKDNIPRHCLDGYIVDALANMLEAALNEYDETISSDYDSEYNTFAKAVRGSWGSSMSDFFENHLDRYYNCFQNFGDDLQPYRCPPYGNTHRGTSVYLEPRDKDGAAKFVLDEYDIDWEAVEHVVEPHAPDIPGVGCNLGPCGQYFIHGVPRVRKDAVVPNPKDAIGTSLANLRELVPYLGDTAEAMGELLLNSDTSPVDVVDGAMVPVFMVQEAVETMKQVYDIGEEIQEEERKFIIFAVITAVLFVLPGVSQALSSVTGIALLAAELGGAALGAYDIATNPDNLAVGIFVLLLGFVGVGGAVSGTWRQAASLRRGMKPDDLARLGTSVKNKVDLVDSLVKVCRAR